MARLADEQKPTTTAPARAVPSSRRSLVMVVGSGRSGTSLFTGILERLGFHVPEPQLPADETNPRGFAESKWVVDFHRRLLKQAGVETADARPAAWAQMARVALDDGVARELRGWLAKQYNEADNLVIKDPRLSWFLPLWRRCAGELETPPRFVTVLRHPAAVVQSKLRSYGSWQGDIARAAGWINQALFTERATRRDPRVFIQHTDLLDDWTRVVARVGNVLDLAAIRDAPAAATVRAHEFVDRSLSQSRASWDEFDIPVALREQADEVWELMCRLTTDEEADSPALSASLDAARAAYTELYEDAEAIAQSSIVAARHPRAARKGRQTRALVGFARRVVPTRYRRKIPVHWRRTIVRVLERSATTSR